MGGITLCDFPVLLVPRAFIGHDGTPWFFCNLLQLAGKIQPVGCWLLARVRRTHRPI
jgi:hypothetical protein